RKQKDFQEPLFKSYLFAKIDESEIGKIKSIDGVLNFLYWKDSPAVIKEEEIKAIKEFTIDYQNISVEKTVVNVTDLARVVDMAKYSFSGNVLSIKNTFAKLSLPSLGFTLVANIEAFNQFDSVPSFADKKLIVQS
ncbi:MAG: transcription termination/antitermination NusG family protein, partial [Ferruginibacter sp.]